MVQQNGQQFTTKQKKNINLMTSFSLSQLQQVWICSCQKKTLSAKKKKKSTSSNNYIFNNRHQP